MATRKTPTTLLTGATLVSPATLKRLQQCLEDTRKEREQQLEGPRPGTAKWQKWRAIPSVPLWKAVMLSLDIEPADWMEHDVRIRDGLHRQLGDSELPDEFWAKLTVCRANVNPSGLIRPKREGDSIVFGEVPLADVAALLARYGLSMPNAMRELVPGAPPAAVQPAAPAPTAPDATAHSASTARVVTNSTKVARTNVLWPAIEEAQRRCQARKGDQWDAVQVWNELCVLADEEYPPLLAATDEGIKYRGGRTPFFTLKHLRERLRERLKQQGKAG